MNVLSLFDGMSCGQIALNRAGIKYDKYYASEIKEHGIKVTKHNYPDTIHLGDVTKIDFSGLPKIDLLIGGSPCQDFSRANKNRLGLRGDKSGLFYYYLKALDLCKPKYFLLENVIMDKKQAEIISNEMGVYPVRINSSLVSAQLRDRLYWTNIPGDDIPDMFSRSIAQPKNKKIKLQDILESGYVKREKSPCVLEGWSRQMVLTNKPYMLRRHNKYMFQIVFITKEIESNNIRTLSTIEIEKLQTVPIGYTDILKNWKNQVCLLGDGWTVDVIAHIFKGLKHEVQK